jgi:hypothetical protein
MAPDCDVGDAWVIARRDSLEAKACGSANSLKRAILDWYPSAGSRTGGKGAKLRWPPGTGFGSSTSEKP